jgi:CubicO group peptidase (beta-lactamase class C family)
MRLMRLFLLLAAGVASAEPAYPPVRFSDPDRVAKLESAMPDIDGVFRDYAAARRIPGMVWGIVIDGQLVHVGASGVQDLASQAPVTAGTIFRIASMTKSFTALSVLQLRDAGRLSLEDAVSKWIPEFSRIKLPTRDTAPLRIRQLLSHDAGFPEDNPWADQQLAARDADLTRALQQGIPFSRPPGTRFEYSNYAFALLGRIVSKASGMPYEEYVRSHILAKLHMDSSTFSSSSVPAARRAVGYRLQPDSTYEEERPLPQGAFDSAGGLLTSAEDLGKYVAFYLSAWPPRDDPEDGPVRRSSVREMSHLWTFSDLNVHQAEGKAQATEGGYGFGLGVKADCRFEHIVAHGGGLPGFGSYMAWLPDYGVGIFAMATLTYSGPSQPINSAWDVLLRTGGLQRREVPASPFLTRMRDPILRLWKHWDDDEATRIAAINLLIDIPGVQRRTEILKLQEEVGECPAAGPLVAEDWLRGRFDLACAKGTVRAFFTLAPTQPPTVQYLKFQKVQAGSGAAGNPNRPPVGVSCPE